MICFCFLENEMNCRKPGAGLAFSLLEPAPSSSLKMLQIYKISEMRKNLAISYAT